MASQNPNDTAAQGDAASHALPDRTQDPADNQQGESKNAAKKAAKAAKLAADKAEKATNKGIGKAEAKKAPKKKLEGAALIGIDVDKNEDFSGWYQQVLTKGDMLDYYDVSGCFIMKPRSYFVWEEIQQHFNQRIKKMGVKNCSFPLFVTESVS